MGITAVAVMAGSVGAIALSTAARVRVSAKPSSIVVKVNAGVPNIVQPHNPDPCSSCAGGAKTTCTRCSGRGAKLPSRTSAPGECHVIKMTWCQISDLYGIFPYSLVAISPRYSRFGCTLHSVSVAFVTACFTSLCTCTGPELRQVWFRTADLIPAVSK